MSTQPRGSERQEDAGVVGGWDAETVVSQHREDAERMQLVVCASDVRQGKSEQQGRARVAPSRERVASGRECKGVGAR